MMRKTFIRGIALLLATACLAAGAQTLPDASPDLRPEVFVSGQWQPGHINTMVRQRDGKLLVGGSFDRVSGSITRYSLLRLNVNGTLDSSFAPEFASGTALEIQALEVAGDAIYVGGLFESVGGVQRFSIAKLHLDGSLDSGWTSPFPSTAANEIHAIAVTAAGVFVAGDLQFNNAYGLMKLDLDTGAADTSWVAQTFFSPGSSSRGEVFALRAIGNDLFVGGEFGQVAGVAKAGVARISQSAPVAVRAFDGGVNGVVYAIEPDGSRVYVGGNFFRAVGSGPNYLNRLDATSGALDAGWTPSPGGGVFALHRVVGMLYAGGSFGSEPAGGSRLARYPVSGSGSVDASWNPNADNTVLAIADGCHGNLLVGGNFLAVSGATRDGLAAFTVPQVDCLFADGFDPR